MTASGSTSVSEQQKPICSNYYATLHCCQEEFFFFFSSESRYTGTGKADQDCVLKYADRVGEHVCK